MVVLLALPYAVTQKVIETCGAEEKKIQGNIS